MSGIKVLMVDNYDSFTFNIVQYLGELGAVVDVLRNDEVTLDELQARLDSGGMDRLVISPGPCSPAEAGISVPARALARRSAARSCGRKR
jgi:anthranilate synthase component II